MEKKKLLKGIFIIALLIILIFGVSLLSKAAEGELISISFDDKNLYNSIIEELGNKIETHDNSSQTVGIRENVLAEVKSLSLYNRDIANISGIEKFTSLTTLNLSGNNRLSDISKLSILTNITVLDLSRDTSITSIAPLSNLNNMIELNLSNIPVGSISSISNLTKLQKLNISGCSMSNDATIRNFVNLKELNISNNRTLTDFDCVTLVSLRVLNVADTGITAIADIQNYDAITGIKRMRNLEELDLSGCTYVQNIDAIYSTFSIDIEPYSETYLKNLKKLKLNRLNLNSFGNISVLTNLTNLEMSSNELTYIDSQIVNLKNLKYIDFSYNKLQNTDGLVIEEYVNDSIVHTPVTATTIKLQHNEIGSYENGKSGIDSFSYMNDIDELDLSYNKIMYVSDIQRYISNNSSTTVYLDHQEANWSVFGKITRQDQYIILPGLMQASKNNNCKLYTTQDFTENGLTLNRNPKYLVNGYYNVIIEGNKGLEDIMSLTINGGIADGSVMNFQMNPYDNSAIDSIMFEDDNLAQAITDEFRKKAANNEIQYINYAPMLINTLNSDITTVTQLDLSNRDDVDSNKIKNLAGLSNFTALISLNMSNNKLSTQNESKISELSTLTNLNTLYLNRNQIEDYSFIENMYYLKILDLSDNRINSTEQLAKLIKNAVENSGGFYVESFNISNNSLKNSDIETIKQLTNLQTLGISNTGITEIEGLKDIINLKNLYIDSNGITDISVVKNYKDLKNLSMSNNNISDIESLRGLGLATLNISKNKISDISALQGMTSLTSLDMSQNKIENVTGIINRLTMDTTEFKMQNQRITRQIQEGMTGTIQVELPQVFKDARNSSSKYIYTTQDLVLNNCTLSSDENYVLINVDKLGKNVATVTIRGGQADGTRLAVGKPVEAKITYNITQKTKGPVVATITFDKPNVTVTNNDGNTSYTFNENGSFEFEYQDEYGFIGTKLAQVEWIDNTAPSVIVEYSITNKTNQDVIVKIKANEEIRPVAGWNLIENNMTLEKTYTSNGTEDVKIIDTVGNETIKTITVGNIDKNAPVIKGVANGETLDKNVLPIITDESNIVITLTKDGQIVSYNNGDYITENGSYELKVEDEAGNVTTIQFTIQKAEEKDDTVISNVYNVDNNKIMRVKPTTTVREFKNNISCESSYIIKDNNNNEMPDKSYISTNCKVVVETGREYTIIVLGDANGNGQIDLKDLANVQKMYLGIQTPTNIETLVFDLNNSKQIDLKDLANLQKVYLGIINL